MSYGDCYECDSTLRNGEGLCHECVDPLKARVAELEAALRDIEKYTNGPSTQTWTREGVILKCRAALAGPSASVSTGRPLDTERCDVTGCEAGSTIAAVVVWLREWASTSNDAISQSDRELLCDAANELESGSWRGVPTGSTGP